MSTNPVDKIRQLKKKRARAHFEVLHCGSPVTLLQGPKTKETIRKAAALTLRYSDKKGRKVLVRYGRGKMDRAIVVSALGLYIVGEVRIK